VVNEICIQGEAIQQIRTEQTRQATALAMLAEAFNRTERALTELVGLVREMRDSSLREKEIGKGTREKIAILFQKGRERDVLIQQQSKELREYIDMKVDKLQDEHHALEDKVVNIQNHIAVESGRRNQWLDTRNLIPVLCTTIVTLIALWGILK
jgi:hypothetical protein